MEKRIHFETYESSVRILALDLATTTGWSHSTGTSGVFQIDLKRGDSPGVKWLKFSSWLRAILEEFPCDLIVYEQAHHRGGASTHSAHGLISLVETWAAHFHIEISSYHTSKVKKIATGSGRGSKEEMVQAAETKFGIQIFDDNHADALFLLELAKNEFCPAN